ncbi:hypothetical protein [Cognaticolwellia beringensis]|uniref:hypothetical protein n=1 Tax=Cognaticolwellia beringensis TaxID=1967665 RepID=UPI0012F8DE69|nr:hypothetical protein [Cognaticolwellia beringensis]
MRFIGIVVFLILGLPSYAWAEQLDFSKKITDEYVQFNYQWLDQAQQTQSLSFAINKVIIFDRFRNFKGYSAPHAKKYVDQKIRQKLSQNPIDNVQTKFIGTGDNLQIELKSDNQNTLDQAYKTITKLKQGFMSEHLARNFYTQFVSYDNNVSIKPDHVRFAQTSVADFSVLKALILNKVSSQNVREVGDYVLGFVQSIPYSTLESRTTSTGAGFNPPLQTLFQNQGDCDSKVTLTAAIYRALMPRMKMMLVFIDNHALLAINIPSKGNELTITVDGLAYILAEPTGPALMRVGELTADSEFAIRNGRYYAEAFFAEPSAETNSNSLN